MSTTEALATVVERPLVKIAGADMSDQMDANLLDARAELVTNGVSQATLRFYDADFKLLDDASIKVGAAVAISFPAPGGSMAVVFEGEIVGIATDQGPDDLHELTITCFDKAHRMSRSTQMQAYQQVTYADVIGQMARRNGLGAKVPAQLSGTHAYLMQTTDDCTFLTELTERMGAWWRVKGSTLEVALAGAAVASGVTLTWGQDLRRFKTRFSGIEGAEVEVRGWDPMSKQAIVGSGGQPADRTKVGDQQALRSGVKSFGTAKRIVTRDVVTSANEAKAVAIAHRGRGDSTNVFAKGEANGNPMLQPGTTVTVAGVGERFKGDYYLTAVEHVYTQKGYVTRFSAGTASPSTLVDMLETPPRANLGAIIGIVTNNKDTGGMGRVKVKFPTIDDSVESEWARVVNLGGGPSTGLHITPTVNDEVLVVFEGGDLRRPLVLGGLWNGKDKPPLTADVATKAGKTVQWQMRTLAGHTLTFEEGEAGKENVTILLKDTKTKLRLGVDKIELWADRQNIHVKSGDASVLLSGGKDITLEGVNVTIKAKNALKLEAMTFEAKAQTTAKVEAAMIEVKAQAKASLESAAMVEVKGMPVKIN